jgi:hypothetical protein
MSFNKTGYIYTRLTPAKGSLLDPITRVRPSQKFPQVPNTRTKLVWDFCKNVPNTKTSGYVQKLIPDQHWSKLTLGQSKP